MEKAKQAKKRKASLLHLLDGGWRGELPLPGSYDKPASVLAVWHICGDHGEGTASSLPEDAADDGSATYGYLELLPEGDLGGPSGLIVRWTARTPEEGGPLNASLERSPSVSSIRSARSSGSTSILKKGDKQAATDVRGRSTIVAPAGAGTSRHGRSKSPPPVWELDVSPHDERRRERKKSTLGLGAPAIFCSAPAAASTT